MSDTTAEQPDPQPNVLKALMAKAASRSEAAGANLTQGGGNPLRTALAALETAWVSPSYERRAYAESLEGAGSAVVGAFDSQAHHARSLASDEPPKVDPEDPHDGWKASESRIAARAGSPYYGGY